MWVLHETENEPKPGKGSSVRICTLEGTPAASSGTVARHRRLGKLPHRSLAWYPLRSCSSPRRQAHTSCSSQTSFLSRLEVEHKLSVLGNAITGNSRVSPTTGFCTCLKFLLLFLPLYHSFLLTEILLTYFLSELFSFHFGFQTADCGIGSF